MSQAIANGDVVSFHYTLTGPDGAILDSSQGRDPMVYLHGAHNIVPGLERQMTGKTVGAAFIAKVPAAEAYGERQGPGPQTVTRDSFPPEANIQPGMMFEARDPNNNPFPVWIVGVTDEGVQIDINHPLAGVPLTFTVDITHIRPGTEAEIASGHVGATEAPESSCAGNGCCD